MERLALPAPRRERGMTLIVVLVLLIVMLLGGLAFARMSATSVMVAGNAAQKDGALQATEVGINTALFAVDALANDSADIDTWYFAQAKALDDEGLPDGIDWGKAARIDVNGYTVHYVVERLCATTAVVDTRRQCLVRLVEETESAVFGVPLPPPRFAKQYRITARAVGPRGTVTFVQALMTRSLS
jgi:type IV pilus assembly protein PilX